MVRCGNLRRSCQSSPWSLPLLWCHFSSWATFDSHFFCAIKSQTVSRLYPLYHNSPTCRPTELAASWARTPPWLGQELDPPEKTCNHNHHVEGGVPNKGDGDDHVEGDGDDDLKSHLHISFQLLASIILSSLSSPLLLGVISVTSVIRRTSVTNVISSVVKNQSYQGNQYDWVSIYQSIHSSVQLVKSIFRVNLSNWMGVPVFQDSQFCFFSSFSKIVIFVLFFLIFVLLVFLDFPAAEFFYLKFSFLACHCPLSDKMNFARCCLNLKIYHLDKNWKSMQLVFVCVH